MPRKTVNVAALVRRGNLFLANSEDGMTGERRGVASMIEQALFMADAYKGFSYITRQDRRDRFDHTAACQSIGVEFDGDTTSFPDDSRRQYNISGRIA